MLSWVQSAKMAKLSSYITISSSRPSSGEDTCFSAGRWLKLAVPFSRWKEPLRGRWSRLARVIFSSEKPSSESPQPPSYNAPLASSTDLSRDVASEMVCLCAHVKKCPMKGGKEINPLCPKFAFGVCVEATLMENENRPISFATIGYLAGISKQRVEQIYSVAQQRLIDEIRKDPVLAEYCVHHGIGGIPES